MSSKTFAKLVAFGVLGLSAWTGSCAALSHQHYRRQVPQEWAHASEIITVDNMLKKKNPLGIMHPIFALLGDKAAVNGLGQVKPENIDCFQKIVANQAFENAKNEKNKKGQEAAIIFASLERNSPGVGEQTAPCKSMTVNNPEIQRLIQHQDAAGGPDAKKNNVLSAKLAAQSLSDIGSEIKLALRTGTFAAGDPKNPNNGAGLSCDDKEDKEGCIYTKKLLIEDVSVEELEKFVREQKSGNPPK